MRQAKVCYKNKEAGVLTQLEDGSFRFEYLDHWFQDASKPAISLTLPKTEKTYQAMHLFPFFYNMLPEGANKKAVCFGLRIDEDDYFGILLATAQTDTVGAVRVVNMNRTT